MAHAVDEEQLGAGDGRGGGAAAGGVHHLVGGAVHDERRDAQARAAAGCGCPGWSRRASGAAPRRWTSRGRRSPRPWPAPRPGRSGRPASRSSPRSRRCPRRTPSRPRPRRSISTGSRRGCCQPTDRLPVVDMMLVSDRTRPRVLDGHRLRDHAAHRDPDHVGGLEAEVVEQGDGVGGHVASAYGARTRRPAKARTSIDRVTRPPHLGGPAGVAVVVADDVEAALGEHPAELRVPPGHRAAQPHHQQQRLAVGVAEGLVAQLDPGCARGEQLSGDGDLGRADVGVAMATVSTARPPCRRSKHPTYQTLLLGNRHRCDGDAAGTCCRPRASPAPSAGSRAARGERGRRGGALRPRRHRSAADCAAAAVRRAGRGAPRDAGDPGARLPGRRQHAAARWRGCCASTATAPTGPRSTPTPAAPSTPPRSSRTDWSPSRCGAAAGCRSSATAWAGCWPAASPYAGPTWSPGSSPSAARCWRPAPTTRPWPGAWTMLVRLSRAGWPGLMSEDCVAGECARQSFDESRQPAARGRRVHRDLLQARRHRRLARLHRPARRPGRGDRLPRRPGLRPAGEREVQALVAVAQGRASRPTRP